MYSQSLLYALTPYSRITTLLDINIFFSHTSVARTASKLTFVIFCIFGSW